MPTKSQSVFGNLISGLAGSSMGQSFRGTLERMGLKLPSPKKVYRYPKSTFQPSPEVERARSSQRAVRSYRQDREEQEALSADELAKSYLDEMEREDEFTRFMSGKWVNFVSSNVAAGAYYPESLYLEIEFHDGSIYAYFGVSSEEAASLFHAPSKGAWIWDNVRIRKTKLGFRKSYVWLSASSQIQRVWDRTTESAIAHGAEAERQTAEYFKGQKAQGADSLKGAFGS